jgi:hypothetical protein
MPYAGPLVLYLRDVKRADTSKPLLGILHIQTDCEFEKFAKPIAFALVRTQ